MAELPEDKLATAVQNYRSTLGDFPPWWTYHADDPVELMEEAVKAGKALPEEQDDGEFAVMNDQ